MDESCRAVFSLVGVGARLERESKCDGQGWRSAGVAPPQGARAVPSPHALGCFVGCRCSRRHAPRPQSPRRNDVGMVPGEAGLREADSPRKARPWLFQTDAEQTSRRSLCFSVGPWEPRTGPGAQVEAESLRSPLGFVRPVDGSERKSARRPSDFLLNFQFSSVVVFFLSW